jgi:hypothetical protein
MMARVHLKSRDLMNEYVVSRNREPAMEAGSKTPSEGNEENKMAPAAAPAANGRPVPTMSLAPIIPTFLIFRKNSF